MFALISNIIRNTLRDFMWKCRWKFGSKNVEFLTSRMFASDSVSLPRLDNPTGACPTHRRQWADFLVSLMAPLHRQYKTARTETRCHLLLKIRQMATQTSASRGYVLFRSADKRCTKVLKLSADCGHSPRSVQSLEKHGSSEIPNAV